jgi:hypothetical protein
MIGSGNDCKYIFNNDEMVAGEYELWNSTDKPRSYISRNSFIDDCLPGTLIKYID